MDENVLLNRHIIEFASLNKEDLIDWILKFLPLYEDRPLRKWIHSDIVSLFQKDKILRERSQSLCYAVKYINFLNSPFKFSYHLLNSFYESPDRGSGRKSDSNLLTSYFPITQKTNSNDKKCNPADELIDSKILLDTQPVVLVKRLSWRTIEKKLEENKNNSSSSTMTNYSSPPSHLKQLSFTCEDKANDSKMKSDPTCSNSVKRSRSVSLKGENQTCSKKSKKLSSHQSISKDFASKLRSNYRNKLNEDTFLTSLLEDITHDLPCCNKNGTADDRHSKHDSSNKLSKNVHNTTISTNLNAKKTSDCQTTTTLEKNFPESSEATCLFCKQPASCHPEILDLISNENIHVHEKCMYFASGLGQSFIPDSDSKKSNDKTHLNGFSVVDILKEVKRGSKLPCSGCFKKGACSGCVVKNCKRGYHLPCALKQGAICIFDDNFPLYCSAHRPKLDISRWYSNFTSFTGSCCICLDEFTVSEKDLGCNIIHGQCCSECWMHRDCICSFANSAGLHHIKCPLCNDRDEVFLRAIKRMGVWIPDRDAAWELEEGAFGDLYDSNDPSCSLQKCICVNGRKFYEENSRNKWFTMRCAHCLIIGAHRMCLEAQSTHNNVPTPKRFVCEACISLEK